MLEGRDPVLQAFLATLMTWGLTAAGAAMAFFIGGNQRKLLDGSLGFAGGVMVAASFWSLLSPAIDMAQESGRYGSKGQYAFAPVSAGFFLGALFVYGADVLISRVGVHSPLHLDMLGSVMRKRQNRSSNRGSEGRSGEGDGEDEFRSVETVPKEPEGEVKPEVSESDSRYRRMLLLIVAITVHNIPEGLAVGVAFGSVGKSTSATFKSARSLAIGIGIQNFPEGLAVSLPLKSAGLSVAKSIWYGQLSGLVEPAAGVFGAFLVGYMEPVLPYALAFAAGAMIYVVFDDVIPEAQSCGNGKLASWGAMIGFIIMMSLELL